MLVELDYTGEQFKLSFTDGAVVLDGVTTPGKRVAIPDSACYFNSTGNLYTHFYGYPGTFIPI